MWPNLPLAPWEYSRNLEVLQHSLEVLPFPISLWVKPLQDGRRAASTAAFPMLLPCGTVNSLLFKHSLGAVGLCHDLWKGWGRPGQCWVNLDPHCGWATLGHEDSGNYLTQDSNINQENAFEKKKSFTSTIPEKYSCGKASRWNSGCTLCTEQSCEKLDLWLIFKYKLLLYIKDWP